jgi:hypothetical protein
MLRIHPIRESRKKKSEGKVLKRTKNHLVTVILRLGPIHDEGLHPIRLGGKKEKPV